jgi:dihydrofolate synthase/folylpolyglutamate synthase
VNSYRNIINYLYGLQHRGMKFGLRNIKSLLRSVGNPERKVLSLHVAGTNGKGSTASFLASIFLEAGYKTALYTSPHLINFTERIRINGVPISEERLVAYVRHLRPTIERTNATFFEATTCIAFQYFTDEAVDVAVIETGLGGRLDATNVLRPCISVITNVSFDHMEYLGNTLGKIAAEKGGIIKRGVPCVTGSTNPAVVKTVTRIANKKEAPLRIAREVVDVISRKEIDGFPVLDIQAPAFSISQVKLGLPGTHQIQNATTALATLHVLMTGRATRNTFPSITRNAIRAGLERVKQNTGIRGRFEREGRFIFDVAHNEEGIKSLVSSLRDNSQYVVVFGVMRDKEVRPMLELLRPRAAHLIAVEPKITRAMSAGKIAAYCRRLGIPVTNGRTIRKGVATARRIAGRNGSIMITGSHYVVGEALAMLRRADEKV